jgi:predicted RNA-binding Zn-ribbon protein involved in translation (DUF1610 family)
LGVILFTILAGVLFFWLLSFVVDDIGEIRGPQLKDVEKTMLDPVLVSQEATVDRKIEAIAAEIEGLQGRQALLRDSTSSSQQTMNQLLNLQKQSIEKHVSPSAAEQDALGQSENLFLGNQTRYQSLNEEIARKTEERRSLENEKKSLESRLSVQREKAAKRFEQLDRQHHLKVAGLQLLFLIPILLAASYAVLKWRATVYAPLIYAVAVATLSESALVVHEHFPTRYFKYILLLAALAVVVRALVYFIQSSARPKAAALLKQYRQAYEHFLCPTCEYPIRRGPMKYTIWTRRTIGRLAADLSAPMADEPYVCPACGSGLFEVCDHCQGIRHALLPFCNRCGAEGALRAVAPA